MMSWGGACSPKAGRTHTARSLRASLSARALQPDENTAGGAEVNATGRRVELLQWGLYVPFGGVPRQISPQAVLPLDL